MPAVLDLWVQQLVMRHYALAPRPFQFQIGRNGYEPDLNASTPLQVELSVVAREGRKASAAIRAAKVRLISCWRAVFQKHGNMNPRLFLSLRVFLTP